MPLACPVLIVVPDAADSRSPGRTFPMDQNSSADPRIEALSDWSGDWGGLPPFDRVDVSVFEPAIEHAMTMNLREIEEIAGSGAAPSFDNTIAAMERSGRVLDRVLTM